MAIFDRIMKLLFGSKNDRDLRELMPILSRINRLECAAVSYDSGEFKRKTGEFRERLKSGNDTLDTLLPEAFALCREAARRILGERAHDVQVLGSIVLHRGKIMEMKTGEGKTLSSVSAAYLNALTGKGVHIVTVNDYLAQRDRDWMGPVFEYLGLTVGVILSQMDNEARKLAYSCDITYGTNNEFGFDYLRDNMRWFDNERVQNGHNFAVIDEIDSILIDEARTPLIISGQAEDDTQKFYQVNTIVPMLRECDKNPATNDYPEEPAGDYKIDEKSKRVSFTDEGLNNVEALLRKHNFIRGSLFENENFEYIHYITQAVRAHILFHRDVDYVVETGQVQIVDEFTGRILHGRRYSDGLHQAIEAKEKIKIAKRNKTFATITLQNYFRMYEKISGMTGTAETEAREFGKIYGLDVTVIPTNRPVIRDDANDVIYFNEDFKFKAICDEIERLNKKGQPILVGTVSIEKSELLSSLLTKRRIRHEVLNAKQHAREALIIAEAGAKGSVTIATNMAGRGTDIKLGGNPEFRARRNAGTDAPQEVYEKTLADEIRRWQTDYEEVRSLGGLYILGTERHESRRIDNQLRGRSGRQGDPGESRFFISLDDDLMRLFARDNLKNLMGRLGMKGGDPIFHPWITKAIERAQTRVEERNFEIRKHLLEFDDVLNEQRNFIYDQRDRILQDTELTKRIIDTAEDTLGPLLDDFKKSRDDVQTAAAAFIEKLRENFNYNPTDLRDEFIRLEKDTIREKIVDYIRDDLESKSRLIGSERFNQFIRFEYIRAIDVRWQDHLDNLEALREAVYLRSYGQKNPLLEYKLEGFDIFDRLILTIRTYVASKIIRMQIVERPQLVSTGVEHSSTVNHNHVAMSQFAAAGARSRGVNRPEKVQVRRSVPKVGRNDPCPCGSGKKYKKCCGS